MSKVRALVLERQHELSMRDIDLPQQPGPGEVTAIGAAIGGGSGLLLSSMIGMSNAYASGVALQQRYDMAYTQCMVAKGESVPLAQNDSASYPSHYAYRRYPAYPGYSYPGYSYYPYPY